MRLPTATKLRLDRDCWECVECVVLLLSVCTWIRNLVQSFLFWSWSCQVLPNEGHLRWPRGRRIAADDWPYRTFIGIAWQCFLLLRNGVYSLPSSQFSDLVTHLSRHHSTHSLRLYVYPFPHIQINYSLHFRLPESTSIPVSLLHKPTAYRLLVSQYVRASPS